MDQISEADTIVIFGGNGFIGRYLARNLLFTGAKIKIASLHSRPLQNVDVPQISFWNCDIKNKENVFEVCSGATYIVNLVGLRFESGDNNFENIHVTGACNIASAAKNYNVKRLLHLSALTNNTNSRYGETKLRAQKNVLSIFPEATIVRPSLIYGKEGKFINLYARLVKKMLFVPLLWGGRTRIQPLYIEDVALFLSTVLQSESSKVTGKILNIAGPKQYEMLDILHFILKFLNKKRIIIPLPEWAGYALGRSCEILGMKFMSSDLVTLMKEDFILLDNERNAMLDFGIKPRFVEQIIPTYLF